MSSAATSRRIERLYPDDTEIDPEIAEQVGQEILRDRLEPAAWARALASSGGRKQDALAAYARIRMQQVAAHRRMRRAKSQSFEARRLTTCLGIKTVQDLLQRSNRGGQMNLLKPQLSYVWLAILMLGCSGSVASMGRLLGGFLPTSVSAWLPGIALLCGISAVGGVLGLRALLPKRWVMLGWNTGLALVCTMACFGSLALGTKLISRTSPDVIQKLTNGVPPEASQPAAPAPPSAKPMLVKPKISPLAAPAVTSRATASTRGERERGE
ncbi:hypothetical protein [Luteolibacter soli]|uniref:Uncharacterized protein n=1 Tax=Luteolibacter soli TaxID=3135280 RepID=A0ABU9AN57_9BACT